MKAKVTSQRGFTLIELMVVVVIIAILASIAVPNYKTYVTRSKITEAISKLSESRVRMEQYFLDNRSYMNPNGGANVLGCTNQGDLVTAFTDAKNFTFTCSVLTANTYVISAIGIAGQGTDGFTYTIDQSNVKASVITYPASDSGWSTPTTNCWTTKIGGIC
jgi:type IV pilus assembly protein PilE